MNYPQLSPAYNEDVPDQFVMAHAIKDTILFYSADLSRRSQGKLSDGLNSCALGRFCDIESARKDGFPMSSGSRAVKHSKYIHPRLRDLPEKLFNALLELHDTSYYWKQNPATSAGTLTSEGKAYLRNAIRSLGIEGAANIIDLTQLVSE
jgi:hypothetical protein